MRDELKNRVKELTQKLKTLEVYLSIEEKEKTVRDIEQEIAKPDFWTDNKRAEKLIVELKNARAVRDPYSRARAQCHELAELIDIVEEDDEDSLKQLRQDIDRVSRTVNAMEFRSLLSGAEDSSNAIMSINAGAGGTESCDWANMLFRMYAKWSEKKGYQVSVVDLLPGEEAGIKNMTAVIKGDYATGYLKSESGVHRLVRISPFDSNKRRHTSFASVSVIPELAAESDVTVNEADLRIDTYRSSGAGGQHVNVTDSAVRITHMPTGIVVQCQNERSQHKNKSMAMKILKSRLYEREQAKKREAIEQQYAEKREIAWGSQIRSYVLHPYSMVKDHRTGCETSNTTAVMNGDIDNFIEAYLRKQAEEGASTA